MCVPGRHARLGVTHWAGLSTRHGALQPLCGVKKAGNSSAWYAATHTPCVSRNSSVRGMSSTCRRHARPPGVSAPQHAPRAAAGRSLRGPGQQAAIGGLVFAGGRGHPGGARRWSALHVQLLRWGLPQLAACRSEAAGPPGAVPRGAHAGGAGEAEHRWGAGSKAGFTNAARTGPGCARWAPSAASLPHLLRSAGSGCMHVSA
jgi:hypothetical protein